MHLSYNNANTDSLAFGVWKVKLMSQTDMVLELIQRMCSDKASHLGKIKVAATVAEKIKYFEQ